MMGVGKSTIGKKMASILGYQFIDLDKLIENKEGKTIAQIFELLGEDYFRQIESEILKTINDAKTIIATGGGTPCFYNNIHYIKESGISIYLKANSKLIFQRIIRYPNKRPLLKGKSEDEISSYILQKMVEREPFYLQSDYVFEIPSSSAESIVKSILLQVYDIC